MKSKHVLILSCMILASMFVVGSGIAKQDADWENFAGGIITQYNDEPSLSAAIVDGIWNLKIKDDRVWAYVCVQELNIAEGVPDSVDILEYSLQGQPFYHMYLEGTSEEPNALMKPAYVVFGKFQVKKQAAQFDGTYSSKTWKTWMSMEVYEDGDFVINNDPYELASWAKLGEVKYTDLYP